MAERKFDYENVSNVYKNMTSIIGDEADSSSLVGILTSIDRDYKEYVNVEDEAIYGDLGSQLLLDWENTSSNFPNFVENFNNWT